MRFAVIGLGTRIHEIVDLLLRLECNARLVAVADPAVEQVRVRLAKFTRPQEKVELYESAERMLEQADRYDAILIGTRCHLHTPMAIRVVKTGLPLFLEKPVAITAEQAGELAGAFEGREDSVVVSFPLRYTPLFTAALEIVRSGRLGTINQVQAINNVHYGGVYFADWYRNYNEVGGLWLQKATHDFDYINLLIGSRPTQIAATTTRKVYGGDKPHDLRCSACNETESCIESPQNIRRRGDGGGMESDDHWCAFSREIRNEDAGSAIILYENGVHASYSQNFVSRRSAGRRGAIITGYKGTLEFNWFTDKIRIVDHHEDRVDQIEIKGSGEHSGGDDVLVQNFIDVVRGRSKSASTLQDGLLSVSMCLAARESSETHAFRSILCRGVAACRDNSKHLTV